MAEKDFIPWLEQVSGRSRIGLAKMLDVSPSLLSLIAKNIRPVTLKFANRVAERLELPKAVVYQRANLPYLPMENKAIPGEMGGQLVVEEDQLQPQLHPQSLSQQPPQPSTPALMDLQEELARLRYYGHALEYSLAHHLPKRSIEKLKKIVELEIEYNQQVEEEEP
ncbi:hypothetical protein [Heliophilum fasciatum]|uniref:Uncharacterized protein n=1 Tax=Heliophilum fasciatum TaxID=35700 RepID=A0A4R2RN71_9FIRM|nr:hypothetical protein [Heliophilum fasciatum]MCW2279136.1 transcriptional regulator with XRE-family HTH domain [Heliophilum fasciatum]TCP61221.1 hypothetical protein EDD73_13013 [Heliophilum fasciatum]